MTRPYCACTFGLSRSARSSAALKLLQSPRLVLFAGPCLFWAVVKRIVFLRVDGWNWNSSYLSTEGYQFGLQFHITIFRGWKRPIKFLLSENGVRELSKKLRITSHKLGLSAWKPHTQSRHLFLKMTSKHTHTVERQKRRGCPFRNLSIKQFTDVPRHCDTTKPLFW